MSEAWVYTTTVLSLVALANSVSSPK